MLAGLFAHPRWKCHAFATMIKTRLTERFGIKHPIVCAPMALVTGGALAAAVSRAGGLGIVGGGYAGTIGGEPDLDVEVGLAKSEKFGVGFIAWALRQAPDMLTKALKYSRSVSSFPLVTPRRSPRRSTMQAPG